MKAKDISTLISKMTEYDSETDSDRRRSLGIEIDNFSEKASIKEITEIICEYSKYKNGNFS